MTTSRSDDKFDFKASDWPHAAAFFVRQNVVSVQGNKLVTDKRKNARRDEPAVSVGTSRNVCLESATRPSAKKTTLLRSAVGTHIIADFWGARYLGNVKQLERVICLAVEASRATLLHIHLHRFEQGNGVTGVALLAESHISMHTWPERHYAAFDIFMCGESNPQAALQVLRQELMPTCEEIRDIRRGGLNS